MYYTSNERINFSLPTDIFCHIFLIVHISANFVIDGLKFGFLNSSVFNAHVMFQIWVMDIERDIHVQKIKL